MDFTSILSTLLPSLLHQLNQYVPAVPYVVLACLAYLVGNDVLDVLLVRKWNSHARLYDFAQALANDVSDRIALTFATTAAVTALAAGGDFRAAFVSGLVAAAAANVANFEQSTLSKLRELFSSTHQLRF